MTAIYKAAKTGDFELVKKLYTENIPKYRKRNIPECLHIAIVKGRTDIAIWLIEKLNNIAEVFNFLFYLALKRVQVELIKYLYLTYRHLDHNLSLVHVAYGKDNTSIIYEDLNQGYTRRYVSSLVEIFQFAKIFKNTEISKYLFHLLKLHKAECLLLSARAHNLELIFYFLDMIESNEISPHIYCQFIEIINSNIVIITAIIEDRRIIERAHIKKMSATNVDIYKSSLVTMCSSKTIFNNNAVCKKLFTIYGKFKSSEILIILKKLCFENINTKCIDILMQYVDINKYITDLFKKITSSNQPLTNVFKYIIYLSDPFKDDKIMSLMTSKNICYLYCVKFDTWVQLMKLLVNHRLFRIHNANSLITNCYNKQCSDYLLTLPAVSFAMNNDRTEFYKHQSELMKNIKCELIIKTKYNELTS